MDRWKREALNVAIVVIVMIALTFPHDEWGRILFAGLTAVGLIQLHLALRERAWVVNILDGTHQDTHILVDIHDRARLRSRHPRRPGLRPRRALGGGDGAGGARRARGDDRAGRVLAARLTSNARSRLELSLGRAAAGAARVTANDASRGMFLAWGPRVAILLLR
jgi:hypothetical protein